jgi:putative transcription factor
MNCEMCGRLIKGEPILSKVEGAIMDLCAACAKFGEKITTQKPASPTPQKRPPISRSLHPRTFPKTEKRYDQFDAHWEVSPDIGKTVRKYRLNLGLTQKQLATKTNIATTILNRIESGKYIPPLEIARKLEKVMKTQLVTKSEDFVPPPPSSSTGTPTLGDIVKIKNKRDA